MKSTTKTPNGHIFFCYEDYYGHRFRNWDDIAHGGKGCSYLVGYFYSNYANCTEPIMEKVLTGRPSIDFVKRFINDCKSFIFNEI